MAGQNIERREALRVIALASAAAGFPGFRQWAFACDHIMSGATTKVPQNIPYKPLFFSEQHYRLVARLAEMIIPSDEHPGATEAGVPEFIDFMVANRVPVSPTREIRSTQDAIEEGNEAQSRFLAGLNWLNARAVSECRQEFLGCTPDQQNTLLEELAYKAKFKPTTEEGRVFFSFFRDYTVVGYYTSKIGLETLDYPGLRTMWPSMPACAHPDDPAHARLSNASGEGIHKAI